MQYVFTMWHITTEINSGKDNMCLIVVRGGDGTVAASKRLSWQRGTAKGQKEQSFVPFLKTCMGLLFLTTDTIYSISIPQIREQRGIILTTSSTRFNNRTAGKLQGKWSPRVAASESMETHLGFAL